MKKLIFLLIMAVAFVGIVSAMDTAHPPWMLTVNMSDILEATLYGDSADGRAVTPYTVLAMETRNKVDAAMEVREEAVIKATSVPPGVFPVMETDKYARCIDYVIVWGEQYQAGQLSKDEYASLVAGAIGLLRYIKPIGAVSAADTGYHLRC